MSEDPLAPTRGIMVGVVLGVVLWLVLLTADLLTLRIIGAVALVLGVTTLVVYVWSRFASDAVLREMAEEAGKPDDESPQWDEDVRVLRRPYDHEVRGDFS